MSARWVFFSIISTVILAIFLFGYFDSLDDFTGEKEEPQEVPDVHFKEFHTDNFRLQHKDWNLRADSGVGYEKQGKVLLQNVTLHFFEKEKKKEEISSKVTAKSVMLDKKENRLIFEGDVRIASKDGSVLTGQKFIWNDELQQISTTGFARIDRPNGDVIKGIGLTADRDLDDVVFDRNVSGKKVSIQN